METAEFRQYLLDFTLNASKTLSGSELGDNVENLVLGDISVTKVTKEFWTAAQRKASSLHEVSYRACFKPQLPGFFINKLTKPGDFVYDPFSGRGTTAIEAALQRRNIVSNDISPLSEVFTRGRLCAPNITDIEQRLQEIKFDHRFRPNINLSMFYHPRTVSEIVSLRRYLIARVKSGQEDKVDRWIRMVATNRLTGHSSGFFSVYTLPPNQAVSPESQIKINVKRGQVPEYRDVKSIIIKKSNQLLSGLSSSEVENIRQASKEAIYLSRDARNTPEIKDNSVKLTVTSPPFLDIVQYSKDNWLRCWFNDIDPAVIEGKITMSRKIEEWVDVMQEVFYELYRITAPGGCVAFEVGEIRNGKINLEDYVLPIGLRAGFNPEAIMINQQEFTKTSNIWGIKNNNHGTNSNRIVLFRK
jgi:hypothetical protein